MRRGFGIGVAIVISLVGSAFADASPSGQKVYRASSGRNEIVPCDSLPAGAVKTVPPPFDRYMLFECNALTGQGLRPVDGYFWRNQKGTGVGLSSSMQVGGADASGQVRFAYSWYAELTAVVMSGDEQRALHKDFAKEIYPRYLNGATILELRAKTSNGEDKRIFLIVPDPASGPPKWLLGLECNGACFTEDRQPMMFQGAPSGDRPTH